MTHFPLTLFVPQSVLHTHIMSDEGIRPPARKLDEFEKLVYEYTSRMGLGNDEVRLQQLMTRRAGASFASLLYTSTETPKKL